MYKVNVLDKYRTSAIHVSKLIALDLFDDEETATQDDQKAYLVAEHEDDGSWSISAVIPWGDVNAVREDLTLDKMMQDMLLAELASTSHLDVDEDSLGIFLPCAHEWIPNERDIEQMQAYIHSHSLAKNHVCRLALSIGKDKFLMDNIQTQIVYKAIENNQLPHSQKGPNGSKLNLN